MIAIGVDTHKDSHVAVALDDLGQLLFEFAIEAISRGYEQMAKWARSMSERAAAELVIGIEGTGH